MATVPSIPGTEDVLSALGCWPSFHDAEVLNFSLSRGATADAKESEARLDVQVREYEPRHEGTAQYELVLIKNVIIRFAFSGVQDVQVEDFNFQNVINALHFKPETTEGKPRLRVEVEPVYGFGATWLCSSANVAVVSRLPTSEA